MTMNSRKDDLTIGIVGAGLMGRGIAQVSATGGCAVKLYDVRKDSCEEAVSFIEGMLNRAAEKGRMSAEDASAAIARIEIVESMSAFADCDAVIEAATENLDIKRKIFDEMEATVGENVVLATNTSSLSVTTVASSCRHPHRIAGFHFFNPVPLMKLVEVIDGVLTEPWVTDFLVDLGKRMGREPVRVADAPGFLVNQVGRGYNIEAAHLVTDGISTYADVDAIMRDAAGFRMGPFELMDLTALDVTHPATELIYQQFYHEPRYRPSHMMRSRMEAGLLGRKSKKGFYDYSGDETEPAAAKETPAYDGRPVWISGRCPDARGKVLDVLRAGNVAIDKGPTPSDDAVILVTPLGTDATATAVAEGLDPERTLAVDTLFCLAKRRTLMKTAVTNADAVTAAEAALTADGVPATVIQDSPGFVTQRILGMIVNIGCSIAQQRTALPEDIDKAVTLGLGYPRGPLAFGDHLGADRILKILTSIHELTGDPRYRPSPWLRRRAQLGRSLLTPEA